MNQFNNIVWIVRSSIENKSLEFSSKSSAEEALINEFNGDGFILKKIINKSDKNQEIK